MSSSRQSLQARNLAAGSGAAGVGGTLAISGILSAELFAALAGTSLLLCSILWIYFRKRRIRLERERARSQDIDRFHDTLLQSVQGVLLKMHVARDGLHANSPAYGMLTQSLDEADRILGLARDDFVIIRAHAYERGALADSLRAHAALLSANGLDVRIRVRGRDRAMAPAVHREMSWILCETMSNAAMHAGASRLDVELRYRIRHFEARIGDDGAAVPDDLAAGHAGRGLTEVSRRAHGLGAGLSVRWDAGTCVQLSLPAAIAFA